MRGWLQRLILIATTIEFLCGTLAASAQSTLRLPDLIAQAAPDAQGTRIAADTISAIHTNIHGLNIAPAAIQTYEFTSELIEHVHLGGVFESELPLKSGRDERSFSMRGNRDRQSFVLDAPRQRLHQLPLPLPFEFAGELRIRRNQNPIPDEALGYGLKSQLIADIGTINHRILLRYLGGLLKMIDPSNLDRLRLQHSNDAAALQEFLSTFPSAYDLTNRYLDFQPNIKTIQIGSQRINHVAMTAHLKVDKLQKRYPALSQWIERLLTMQLELDLTQRLSSGLNMARWRIDFNTRSLTQEFYTLDGKLIAFTDQFHPDLNQAIDLTNLQNLQSTSVINYRLAVLGLKIISRETVVAADYQDGSTATFRTRIKALSTPAIDGRLLGILPSWAIDLTIPGNMEDYARRFCQGTLAANGNEGSFAVVNIDTTKATTRVEASGGTEIVDNFFLKIGLRIIQSYLWPEPDVIHDAWRLSSAYVHALNSDLQNLLATQTTMSSISH